MKAISEARLYLVTPAIPASLVREVLAAGVGALQLREKDSEARHVIEVGTPMRDAARDAGVPFVVNDRPDVALALDADGVHLGQDDVPPAVAREILGREAIIGRSTHSPAQVDVALEEHVDYFAVGPVHQTPTKPGRPAAGIELVRYAAKVAGGVPWFAIGGIDLDTIDAVVDAGATRVVVVRAVAQAPDPAAAVRALLGRL